LDVTVTSMWLVDLDLTPRRGRELYASLDCIGDHRITGW